MLFLIIGPAFAIAAHVGFGYIKAYIKARYKEYEEFLLFGDGVLGVQYDDETTRDLYKGFLLIDERCMRLSIPFCLGCQRRMLEKLCAVDKSDWWVLFNA